jgi:hypothetical protein
MADFTGGKTSSSMNRCRYDQRRRAGWSRRLVASLNRLISPLSKSAAWPSEELRRVDLQDVGQLPDDLQPHVGPGIVSTRHRRDLAGLQKWQLTAYR